MLREIAKPNRTTSAQTERVGIITAYNGDGSHDVTVDSTLYQSVLSESLSIYRVGATVAVRFRMGKMVIP